MYYLVEELDALVSVALYEKDNAEKCSTPKFIKETSLKITGGIHHLLKKLFAIAVGVYSYLLIFLHKKKK